MKLVRWIPVLGLITPLWLMGCASSDHIRMQGNRFDLPETLPRSSYRLSFETAGVSEIQFTQGNNTAPNMTEPVLESKSGQRGVRAAYAMFDNVEFQFESLPYLKDSLKGVPAFKAKYQFFGAPVGSAKKGNLSFSSTAGTVYLDETLRTSGNPSYVNDITLAALDLAAIGGYRLSDDLMVYGGPFLTLVMYDGSWKRRSFGVADGTGDKYSGTASQFGANLGIAMVSGTDWVVMAEAAYTDLTWDDASDGFTHFGMQLAKILN